MIRLRPARSTDDAMILHWRNEEFIVARSSSRRQITAEEHARWFERVLAQEDCVVFIVEQSGVAAGLVRFDRDADASAVISVYLQQHYTGQGIGVKAIRLGCEQIRNAWSIRRILACVREENRPAARAFERAGFQPCDRADQGCPADHKCFVLDEPGMPVLDTDDQRTIAHFSKLNDKFGVDARALDWGSRESQHLRFKVLSEVRLPPNGSLLDVGCGQGDFYEWMQQAGHQLSYTGLDLTPAMVDRAKSRFPSARFVYGNPLDPSVLPAETFDVVIASGIFYYRQQAPEQHMMRTVSALFARCRHALAFNTLSSLAADHAEREFYADPAATLNSCLALTSRLALRHDYHPRDFTMFLYRKQS